jgi:ribonuclease G
MITRILVSVDRFETRVAITEGDRVTECHIERRGYRSVVGHVWKGRVENVLAGMEAAFVDVGLDKGGFLHIDEVVAIGVPKRRRQIADLLKKGDEIIVQATKDPMGTKGARLSMQLSIAGRFLVYVPYGSGIGVSKRLDEAERDRLRDICARLNVGTGGLIVRTQAAGASARELERDMMLLRRLWEALLARAELVKAPALLYSEADRSLKVIRDLFGEHVDEVLVDDEAQYERILSFLGRTSPELADRVRYYNGQTPLMDAYGVDTALRSTLEKRVDLPSGGSLIIEDTEAMTVIDVNSGRHVGRGNTTLEETITKTNLEAAAEVVRQLRLRDIGGIVIIDFIDMNEQRNRTAVRQALEHALEKDRAKSYVVDISPLGLVEMTRQNISDGPREIMTVICPECGGDGVIASDETYAIEVERALRRELARRPDKAFAVALNPRIAEFVAGEDDAGLDEIEGETGKRLRLEPDPGFAPGEMRLTPIPGR